MSVTNFLLPVHVYRYTFDPPTLPPRIIARDEHSTFRELIGSHCVHLGDCVVELEYKLEHPATRDSNNHATAVLDAEVTVKSKLADLEVAQDNLKKLTCLEHLE